MVKTKFTPQERQETLEWLITHFSQDERICALVLVGSGAVGFDDQFSDIDMIVVVEERGNVVTAYQEWREKLLGMLPVSAHFETEFAPENLLVGIMLENFLELDIGFWALEDLFAKRARWKVVYDRHGGIKELMENSWEKREVLDVDARYQKYLSSVWHYVYHVLMSVQRGQLWRGLHYLEILRNRTIGMYELLEGWEPGEFRRVDALPTDVRQRLAESFPSAVSEEAILTALRWVTELFFQAAAKHDHRIGQPLSQDLKAKLQEMLDELGNER